MPKYRLTSLILAGALLLIPSCTLPCSSSQTSNSLSMKNGYYALHGGSSMPFVLESKAFANGGEIPRKYTCDGADPSPALNWKDIPAGTVSLALIADDPDAPAGTWTHWIIWNIPAKTTVLPESVPLVEVLDNGARQGRNDFKRIGYGGPCPPPGKPHRYFFKLFALDAKIDIKAGAGRKEMELAMKQHVLAQTEIMGIYRR